VHYLGALPVSLEPGRAERPDTYLWSQRPPSKPEPWPKSLSTEPNVRTVLDAGHKVQWGSPVALYLVTKGIAAGVALLAPFFAHQIRWGDWLPEVLALLFTTLTTALLVGDLHRPKKFLTLLTRPNTRSWLVKGAWILIAFSFSVSATLALRLIGYGAQADAVRWASAALGLGVAGYTALLFKQCEGRDLWQGPLLLPHLLAQAVACGAAVLLAADTDNSGLAIALFAALSLHLVLALLERYKQHATENARQGAAFLGAVKIAGIPAWHAGLALGVLVPFALAPFAPYLGWVWAPVLAGLCLYEYAYVRAAQLPPLS
jgi:formate-dependent nitrite reductase membrane component NrfD